MPIEIVVFIAVVGKNNIKVRKGEFICEACGLTLTAVMPIAHRRPCKNEIRDKGLLAMAVMFKGGNGMHATKANTVKIVFMFYAPVIDSCRLLSI